jgi:hypothetical protein
LGRLSGLKAREPIRARLANFEELIRLGDSLHYSENFLNTLLQSVRDMFKIECTPIEARRLAFEHLIQFYLKQVRGFYGRAFGRCSGEGKSAGCSL